jgi:hypothetical protein
LHNTNTNILKTLAYFNVFDYPLTREEIRQFHYKPISYEEINGALAQLQQEGKVYLLDFFYSLKNDISLSDKRIKGNHLALDQMAHAGRAVKITSGFPFIRGLGISGSLSKNYADENTDIDFFIITQKNRLWVARTLLQLFYKLNYFTGRQKWYCFNYYIDEAALEIEEKNEFTAMEIVTILPMYSRQVFESFLLANKWAGDFFPNTCTNWKYVQEHKKNIFSRFFEGCMNTRLGNWLDNLLWRISSKRWQKKEAAHQLNDRGKRIGLVTGKHIAKPNPRNFQQGVLSKYRAAVDKLE